MIFKIVYSLCALFFYQINLNCFSQSIDDYRGSWQGDMQMRWGNNKDSILYFELILPQINGNVLTGTESVLNKRNHSKSLNHSDNLEVQYSETDHTIFYYGYFVSPDKRKVSKGPCIFHIDKNRLIGKFYPEKENGIAIEMVLSKQNTDLANEESDISNTQNLNYSNSNNNSSNNTSNARVKLKADHFFPFQEGLAIVQFGTSYGIIDNTGNFLIPYNKYIFEKFGLGSLEPEHGFINGGCIVKNNNTGLLGMINAKGVLLIPTEYLLIYPYDDEGWARITDVKNNDFFINKTGTKIPIDKGFYYYREGILSKNGGIEDLFNGGPTRDRAIGGKTYAGKFYNGISSGRIENGKFSFFNRSGKQVINDKFMSAEPFYEGLACVSKINEFGETKYGFINTNGKVVIPYNFSLKPGNFFNGLAYVEPSNKQDFDFAFINKQGEIILKQKNMKPVTQLDPHFEDGYFRMFDKTNNTLFIIDTNGNNNKMISNLRSKINGINIESGILYPFRNHIEIFNYNDGSRYQSSGFVNIGNNKLVYTNLKIVSEFDPLSGLALAINPENRKPLYINLFGDIVFETADRSDW